MLRVTIELVPFGDEARKRTLETIEIGNVADCGDELCLYEARQGSRSVEFGHNRSEGAVACVRDALEALAR